MDIPLPIGILFPIEITFHIEIVFPNEIALPICDGFVTGFGFAIGIALRLVFGSPLGLKLDLLLALT